MFKFHYEEIFRKYESRAKLVYTDTDSFIYHIQTFDLYKDMKDNMDAYDTSYYQVNAPSLEDKRQGPRQEEGRMLDFVNARICWASCQNV